jgi:hypothetical protein
MPYCITGYHVQVCGNFVSYSRGFNFKSQPEAQTYSLIFVVLFSPSTKIMG